MSKITLLAISVLIVLIAAVFFIQVTRNDEIKIESFGDCIKAGNPVMESYPRRCRSSEGKTFVEDIGNELEKLDIIRISTPRPNQIINSPLVIEGEARGNWFFEGDFPIKLLDVNGNVIKTSFARALDEWMVEDFVPFRAEIEFAAPSTGGGTLILEKDNPSGLPEHAEELRVPVKFSDEIIILEDTGILAGKVDIGPLCPVEPCPGPIPNVYLSRMLILQSESGKVISIGLNSDGSFNAQVPVGIHTLTLSDCDFLGCRRALPKTITIEASKTTITNITIDTGIR